jgi:hypothetical protein
MQAMEQAVDAHGQNMQYALAGKLDIEIVTLTDIQHGGLYSAQYVTVSQYSFMT